MRDEYTHLVQYAPWLKSNPYVSRMLKKEEQMREQEKMHPMSTLPAHSGWIILLQNRVRLNSVGNVELKRRVYYESRTRKVGDTREHCDTLFRLARLRNGQPAAGWMEDG